MTALYVFAAIFGGLLLVVFLVGGDLDADVDADFDIDGDVEMGGASGTALNLLAGIFSIRNIVFFLAFFGMSGLIFGALGSGGAVAFVLAGAVGLVAAVMNHKLLDYIKRTDSDSTIGDSRISGSVAKVVLPIAHERKGRVAVTVDGNRLNLVALPYRSSEDTSFDVGDKVVIVAVEDGSAYVTDADF